MKFSIPIPTYSIYVNLYISSNQKKLDRWDKAIAKEMGYENNGFTSQGRSYDLYTNKEGFRCADIVLRKDKLNFGLIAHELFHCVSYIMKHVDIPLSEESEEAYTYLIGYLTEMIHRELGSKLH